MGDWVRYKLDRQVDHVLVDEAQDTNAAQWEIIERAGRGIFQRIERGRGARAGPCSWSATSSRRSTASRGPTRAVPRGARRCSSSARRGQRRRRPSSAISVRAREFRDLSIAASFRSAQPVLDVVDAVIETVGTEAMALDEAAAAARAHMPIGRARSSFGSRSPSRNRRTTVDEGEERWVGLRDRRYADALAERIRPMVDEAPVLASTGRPLTPGDILVLVRSRGELASLIVARLFSAGVPVAGVDRLHLHEPLAVQDLLAAVKFAVQPQRRPQPRLPAGFAADRLGPGPAARSRLWAEAAACGASCASARRE